MILITNGNENGLSFWYSFYRQKQMIRVIPWAIYRQWLPLRIALTAALVVTGGLLLESGPRSPQMWKDVYSVLAIVSTVAQLWFFLPRQSMVMTDSTRTSVIPAAGVEFCGTYIVLSMLLWIIANRPDTPDVAKALVILSVFTLMLAALPVVTLIGYCLGWGPGRRIRT